jgi:hypothetical protein
MVKRSPQRLAWSVLLISFLSCCALTVGVPTGAIALINNSTYAALINIKLQAGRTIAYGQAETEADARVVDQSGRDVDELSTIIVDGDLPSQAFLTIRESDAVTTSLVTMQLYSGTRVKIERARVPRFGIATSPIEITIKLISGRVQIQSEALSSRPVRLEVRSEQMDSLLSPGAYSLEISQDETSLFVREGAAQLTSIAKPETFTIQANQRTIVRSGEGIVPGLYAPPRDLIRDGHFQSALGDTWETISEVYVPGDISGTVRIIGNSANNTLILERPGVGLNWGRTGVRQEILENVSGRTSLQLRINFTILFQELKVCGGQGSECPLMAKINYRNTEGGTKEWTQGFYADGTPHMPDLPDFIVQSADLRTKHIATRLGIAEPYESPNLLGIIPDITTINWIQIYAEGHGVQTQINSVELLILD